MLKWLLVGGFLLGVCHAAALAQKGVVAGENTLLVVEHGVTTDTIGIEYYSTKLSNQGSVDSNKAVIEADYTAGKSTSGYCRTQLQSLNQHANQHLCSGGSNSNIGQRFAVTFFESVGGVSWVFRVYMDSGHGYSVYLDGNKVGSLTGDVWSGGTNPKDYTLTNVASGYHTFVVYGGEGCCDGEAGSWQVKRDNNFFLPLTVANLQALKSSQTMGIQYYSTNLSNQGTVEKNKDAIESAYNSKTVSSGCCFAKLNDVNLHSNQRLCSGGKNNNFGQRFEVTFFEPEGEAEWIFSVYLDAGWGYGVYVDGQQIGAMRQDVWSGGTNPKQYTASNLGVGYHSFIVYGGEGCCDGEAGAWKFQRNGHGFVSLTTTNIRTLAEAPSVGLEYYSTQLSNQGTVEKNKDAIEAAYWEKSLSSGYCFVVLSNMNLHSNQRLCSGGKNSNIGQRFAVTFFEPQGSAEWKFKIYIDAGWGYGVYLDGQQIGAVRQDVWSGDTNPKEYTLTNVGAGFHKLIIYGGEGCCDGEAGAWQFQRNAHGYQLLTTTSLQAAAATPFVGVSYYSTLLQNKGSVESNMEAIQKSFVAKQFTDGYCYALPANLNVHSNQGLCSGGKNSNIGQRYNIGFFEPEGAAEWTFKVYVDAGWGYGVYFDDKQIGVLRGDVWSGGTNPKEYTITDVSTGFHSLTVYGGEGCCDGNAGAWAFKRNRRAYAEISKANLEAEARLQRFPGIGYYSTMLVHSQSAEANVRAIEDDFLGGVARTGYCRATLGNLAKHANSQLCVGGYTSSLGQRFSIAFFEPVGSVNWAFQVYVDSSFGFSAYLDGQLVESRPAAHSASHSFALSNVAAGRHTFVVYSGSSCCDAQVGAWTFKRGDGQSLAVTLENLSAAGEAAAPAITYYSTGFTNLGSLDLMKTYISTKFNGRVTSHGYCYRYLTDMSRHSNQQLCSGGSNTAIGQRFAVKFYEPSANAEWKFTVYIDAGYGYSVYMDNNKIGSLTGDVWGGGTNPKTYTAQLSTGEHTLTVFGGEGCCDGEAGKWTFSRNGQSFDLTRDNLEAAIVPKASLATSIPVTLPNVARHGTPFGSGSLANYCSDSSAGTGVNSRTGFHCYSNINDGKYGNSNSWIGGSGNVNGAVFAGVSLESSVSLSYFAFGRDQTGAYTDRAGGSFTLQYSTTVGADHTTTNWRNVAVVQMATAGRNQFVIEPAVIGAAFRIVSPNGDSCVDELELFGTWESTAREGQTALLETSLIPSNLANLARNGTAFGSGSLQDYCTNTEAGTGAGSRTGVHCYSNINDGKYGNSNSWIAGTNTFHGKSFAGVTFGDSAAISYFTVGRDQTSNYHDRLGSNLYFEFTTDTNADHATTNWTVAAEFHLANASRHQFALSPAVQGTAFRIRVDDNSACLDELELFGVWASGGPVGNLWSHSTTNDNAAEIGQRFTVTFFEPQGGVDWTFEGMFASDLATMGAVDGIATSKVAGTSLTPTKFVASRLSAGLHLFVVYGGAGCCSGQWQFRRGTSDAKDLTSANLLAASTIEVPGISYFSTYLENHNSTQANADFIERAFDSKRVSHGYCYRALYNMKLHSNQKLCSSGSKSNIGQRFEIGFTEPQGGAQWEFRIFMDSGWGYTVDVDGTSIGGFDGDAGGNSPKIYTLANVASGSHKLIVRGGENCCDDNLGEWEFLRTPSATGQVLLALGQQQFTPLTTANLAVIASCAGNPCGSNSICDVVNGDRVCSCADGYTGQPPETACKATCDTVQCSTGFSNYGSSKTCDGACTTALCCADVNECSATLNPCTKAHTVCANTQGSYTCNCETNYYLKGDECLQTCAAYTCPTPAHKISGTDSKQCAAATCTKEECCELGCDTFTCSTGYDNQATQLCSDFLCDDATCCKQHDFCAESPCPAHSTCANGAGSYTCTCDSGYYSNGTSCFATCATTTCPTSWVSSQDNTTQCGAESCTSAQCCNPTCATHTCSKGQIMDSTLECDTSCTDATCCDQCLDNPCGEHALCVRNSTGGYTCECLSGYGWDSTTSSCVSTCSSYSTCPTGYTSATPTTLCAATGCTESVCCTDIDECQTNTFSCPLALTHCSNTNGSYVCVCDDGYSEYEDRCVPTCSTYTCPALYTLKSSPETRRCVTNDTCTQYLCCDATCATQTCTVMVDNADSVCPGGDCTACCFSCGTPLIKYYSTSTAGLTDIAAIETMLTENYAAGTASTTGCCSSENLLKPNANNSPICRRGATTNVAQRTSITFSESSASGSWIFTTQFDLTYGLTAYCGGSTVSYAPDSTGVNDVTINCDVTTGTHELLIFSAQMNSFPAGKGFYKFSHNGGAETELTTTTLALECSS